MAEHPPRAGTNGSARRPLPPVVEAFANRGCARLEVDAAPRQVRIRQRGEMWLKPDGRSLSFSAWFAQMEDGSRRLALITAAGVCACYNHSSLPIIRLA